MNSITIQLCAEDRARIDTVIELLGGLRQPNCSACVKGVAEYMDKAAAIMDAQHTAAPAVEVPAPVEQAQEVPAKPAVTLEQIQKKATQLAAGPDSKKAALRAIIHKYAAKVTALPESSWPAVWDALCALEREA